MEIKKLILNTKENFESAENIATSLSQLKTDYKSFFNDLQSSWHKSFDSDLIELFDYDKEYKFYIKLSNEVSPDEKLFNKKGCFHFDIYPLKNTVLGFANIDVSKPFREILKNSVKAEDFYFENHNYTCWITPKLCDFSFESYHFITNKNDEWKKVVLLEAKLLINNFIAELNKMAKTDPKIKNIKGLV